MASPIINFQGISGQQVAAQYENLPQGSQVVFVNETSGKALPSPVTAAVSSSGAKRPLEGLTIKRV